MIISQVFLYKYLCRYAELIVYSVFLFPFPNLNYQINFARLLNQPYKAVLKQTKGLPASTCPHVRGVITQIFGKSLPVENYDLSITVNFGSKAPSFEDGLIYNCFSKRYIGKFR